MSNQRVQRHRASKRLSLGEDEYKRLESEKRRLRRNANKPVAVIKTDPCDKMIQKVYKYKSAQLAKLTPPRTIKIESVAQQIKKITNLYFKITGLVSDCSDFSFLTDTKKVLDFINANFNTANSRSSQVQSISSILIALPEYKKEYEFYSKQSILDRNLINKTDDNNEITDKERPNIVPWLDIKNLYKTVRSDKDKALIALYTLLPPRRVSDIALLTISEDDYDDKLNHIIVDKNDQPKLFIYNVYKTNKTYGKVTINIPSRLSDILKTYIDNQGLELGSPLFPTASDDYYKNFSEVVTNTFKKYTNKNINVNLLRHAYITNFLNVKRSINDKKDLSRLMGHSISTQSKYDRVDL
jgi:site-specific recombinase XerD